MRQLAGLGVAAIAYVGRVSAGARAAADQTGVALLQLPAAADLGVAGTGGVAPHHRAAARRAAPRSGGGPPADGAGDRRRAAGGDRPRARRALRPRRRPRGPGRPHPRPPRRRRTAAGNRRSRRCSRPPAPASLDWLRGTAASSPAEPQTAILPLDDGWCRVVAPVIGRDGLLGNLSLIVPGPDRGAGGRRDHLARGGGLRGRDGARAGDPRRPPRDRAERARRGAGRRAAQRGDAAAAGQTSRPRSARAARRAGRPDRPEPARPASPDPARGGGRRSKR